jgi:hypothetical protein
MERNCNQIVRLKENRPKSDSKSKLNFKKMANLLIIREDGQYVCTAYWVIRVRSAVRKYRKRAAAFEAHPLAPEAARRKSKAFKRVKRLYKKRPDDPRVDQGILPEEQEEGFFQIHEGMLKIRDVYFNYKGEVLVMPF